MARDRTKSPSEPNGKEHKHEESEGVEEKRHGEDEEPHSKKKDRRKKSKRKYESSTDDGDDSSEDEGDKKQGKGKKKKDKRKRSSKRSSRKRYSDEDSSSSEPYSSDSEESESESGSESSGHESESEEERRRRKSKERKRRRKEREYEKEKRRKRKEKERKRKRKRKEKEERKKKKEGKKGAVTNSWGKYGIIRETDMWNKRPEFTAWLAEVKKVNLESLPNWEEKQMFKEFMEDHNTATFSSKKYYDLEAYHRHKLENEMKKGLKNLGKAERTIFDDEAQRRKELLIAREKQKEEEVETLKRSMQGGMAQAMKEQAQLREEMAYQYKLGNFEAAAAIQRRLDPDVAM